MPYACGSTTHPTRADPLASASAKTGDKTVSKTRSPCFNHRRNTSVKRGAPNTLLSGVSKNVKLDLLEAKPYQSGGVMFRYARANESAQ